MACGRDRVAWPDAYEAIARATDGRAFFNPDGALYYRMGPRETREGYPFPERRPVAGVVELPPGFAPLAGVDAIFTPLDPRVAELEDGPPPRDDRSGREAAFAPALTPKPAAKPAAKAQAAPEQAPAQTPVPPSDSKSKSDSQSDRTSGSKPLETASTDTSGTATSRTAKSGPDNPQTAPAAAAAPRPEVKAAAPEPAAPPVVAATPASPAPGSSAPVTPTILNLPGAKAVENASKTETVVAAAEMSPPPQTQSGAGARVDGWSASGGEKSPMSVPPIAFAILIAAATLAALLVILKKQAEAPVGAGPVRVPVEPMLPGFDRAPTEPAGQSLTVREDPGPPVVSAIAASTGMPVTRDDALAFLGLSAGASESVIRKVVEGLRQSWHPDLAADDTDRAAREERIKAINAAAAILQRKSAA
jgi:hypothetical protein